MKDLRMLLMSAPLLLQMSAAPLILAVPVTTLLLAISATPLIAADEDGGTRSVFAYGIGNRALGMGGAFVAIADDASAPVWNPGGLGFVARREFQGSLAQLYDLEMSEQHAAVVLPSWRWGVAAFTFRHFGADGIKGRDDRNVPTDENLTAGETEIALSYGRMLGEFWSLGGSLKLNHQSVAGMSASSISADVGLLLRPGEMLGASGVWARRLSMGLALRNILEPSLRLDQDNVTDPITMRLGTAYRMPIGWGGMAVASIELERSPDMSPRINAGFEYRPHAMFALRSGFNYGRPVLGAEVQWGNLALDYLFEDNELETVHRLGFSLKFGATVEESRMASLRAEEEALQARLTDAFEQRSVGRINDLMSDAEMAQQEKRYDDALEILAIIQTLMPDLEAAKAKEAECWRLKAVQLESAEEYADAALAYNRVLTITPDDSTTAMDLERCHREGNERARRSEALHERFAAALDSFSEGDLRAAREGFAEITKANPNDQEAAAMLRRTELAISSRVDELLVESERYSMGGLYVEAGETIARARNLDPGARGLHRAEASLARRRRESAATEEPGSRIIIPAQSVATAENGQPVELNIPAPQLSSQERRRVEDLYRQGIEAMEAGRSQDALHYWELAHSTDPNHPQVNEYLKREYLMRGMDSFANGELNEAVSYWEKALEVDPLDDKARGYLARAQQQLSRTREILGGGR
ncbi:MAG: PorV/PorQ family protein [bacterium]